MPNNDKAMSLAKAARRWPGGPISRWTIARYAGARGITIAGITIRLRTTYVSARKRVVTPTAIEQFLTAVNLAASTHRAAIAASDLPDAARRAQAEADEQSLNARLRRLGVGGRRRREHAA